MNILLSSFEDAEDFRADANAFEDALLAAAIDLQRRGEAVPWSQPPWNTIDRSKLVLLGGSGSGNFGHSGRPGKIGGSSPAHLDNPDREPTTEAERLSAISSYRAMDYVGINNTLRGTFDYEKDPMVGALPELQERIAKTIYALDDLIADEPPLTERIIVYRGVNSGVLEDVVEGDTFVDNGFVSTSTDPKISSRFGNYMVEIELPVGAKVLDVVAAYRRSKRVPWEEDEVPNKFLHPEYSGLDPVEAAAGFEKWKENYWKTHQGEAAEQETILPRGSRFEVVRVAKGVSDRTTPQVRLRLIV